MSKDLTSKSIAEEIINLCYVKAIKESTDKDGNETWYMDAELIGKVIDEYLPSQIDELVKQKVKEAEKEAYAKGYNDGFLDA